jgi:hypothetical protein
MGAIDNFRAAAGESRGFARPSKYIARIHPPALFTSQGYENNTYVANGQTIRGDNEEFFRASDALHQLHYNSYGTIDLYCSSIEMPGHDLQTQQLQHGSAPVVDIVQGHAFEGMITASFYLSADLKERHFFEQWQRLAVNMGTHKANYYDDYVGSIDLFQLSNTFDTSVIFPFPNPIDKVIDIDYLNYGINASEVYPATISGVEYSYESGNQIATMAVGFNYREWRNLGDNNPGLRPYY